MKLNHDEIKEKLPEYMKEGIMTEEVRMHLESCKECREELSLLHLLKEAPVPEPGGMFFETLPQKIRMSLKEKKKSFFLRRFVPAFALLAVLVITGYMYQALRQPVVNDEILSANPFTEQTYDLSGLSEDNIPSIALAVADDEIYLAEEPSFLMELASLSPEELDGLYEELKNQNENGGVL